MSWSWQDALEWATSLTLFGSDGGVPGISRRDLSSIPRTEIFNKRIVEKYGSFDNYITCLELGAEALQDFHEMMDFIIRIEQL